MKKLIATATLFGVIIVNAATAQAGMLMSDLFGGTNEPTSCSQQTDIKVPTVGVEYGIIVKFVGIIVKATDGGVSADNCTPVNNGMLMSD